MKFGCPGDPTKVYKQQCDWYESTEKVSDIYLLVLSTWRHMPNNWWYFSLTNDLKIQETCQTMEGLHCIIWKTP